MRLNRTRLNWGVFLIALGAVPLAVHQGVVAAWSLDDIFRLWPLVLIAIGIGFVLARTRANFVSGVLLAACFGLAVGGTIAAGPQFGCGSGASPALTTQRDGTFSGPARVELRLACGTADVSAAGGSRWQVGAGTSRGGSPQIDATATSLTLRSGTGFHLSGGREVWQVVLPTDQPINLSASIDAGDGRLSFRGSTLSSASVSVNAASARLDFGGASVARFSISTNLASTTLILDGSTDTSGSLSTNLGSIEVCAPPGLGLQIRSSEALASSNLGPAGLVRVGDNWQTTDFASSAHRATLSASTNLGSLTLNPSGGCK